MAKYTLSDIFEGDYPISQYYGNNIAYYSQFGLYLGHEGVDWATPVGINVICPFNIGNIIRVGVDPSYGNYVVIWNEAQRCAVWYCHLSRLLVRAGDSVTRNTPVGLTGSTGNVTGPHLHVNFVETDAFANRLNTNNGNQGFLNILDPGLVQWDLAGNQPTQPSDSDLVKQIKEKVRSSLSDTQFREYVESLLKV